jgi:hypothetical protein
MSSLNVILGVVAAGVVGGTLYLAATSGATSTSSAPKSGGRAPAPAGDITKAAPKVIGPPPGATMAPSDPEGVIGSILGVRNPTERDVIAANWNNQWVPNEGWEGEVVEVHDTPLRGGLLVELGEHQQALDQVLHPQPLLGDDLGEGKFVDEFHSLGRKIFELDHVASTPLTQLHQRSGVIGRCQNRCAKEWFFDVVDFIGWRQLAWIIDRKCRAIRFVDDVLHRRRSSDQRKIEFTLKTFSDDFHVQKPEEAAAEPESKSARTFRRIGVTRIIESKLFESFAKSCELITIDWIEAAKDHGSRLVIAVKRRRGLRQIGDGLTGTRFANIFDPGNEVTHLARTERGHGRWVRTADSNLFGVVDRSGLNELESSAGVQRSIHDSDGRNNAAILIEMRIEDQTL